MDGAEASAAIVNRDEPIPMLNATSSTIFAPHDLPASEVLGNASHDGAAGKIRPGLGLQYPLFSRLLAQVVSDDGRSGADMGGVKQTTKGTGPQVDRPNFSLPLMSANFRRFNARIGVVFVFQNRMIQLFSWRNPSHTLSFLAVYTFCCLDLNLLLILPLFGCLLFVMVPAFLSRHPAPPKGQVTDVFTLQGPASAPARDIKPAPEMSKDFFRNMRDLQNSMEDFSVVHDRLIALVTPVTNFSDERLSSLVFVTIFAFACILFIAANSIPWRAILLLGGWTFLCSSHPSAASVLGSVARGNISAPWSSVHSGLMGLARADMVLDEPPETRQVEIFELQKHREGVEWQPWVYSPSPYNPQSPRRISGETPRGTRFFEDIKPPKGWDWKGKKWTLDLFSRDWVEERLITAVEVETEGERWVYDIGAGDPTNYAHGAKPLHQSWEEGSGAGPKGEWRRRRWVRLVQRRSQSAV